MTGFDSFEDEGYDSESAITMFDEEGNEINYHMLATKEDSGCLFMLAEELLEEDVAEVLIFKCKAEDLNSEDEEMIFELVDVDHEDFEKAFELFKSDFDEMGIEY